MAVDGINKTQKKPCPIFCTAIGLTAEVIFFTEKTMKTDLVKLYKNYYSAGSEPELVEFTPVRYLSIQGIGDPSEPLFAAKVEALYSTAYKLKFRYKAEDKDFVVAKLEGLWSYDENKYPDLDIITAMSVPRTEWHYRLLIRIPEYIEEKHVSGTVKELIEAKSMSMAAEVSLFIMSEGPCVQMMHSGPFNTEQETIAKICQFMEKHLLKRNGIHHEIYLSDFRKTAPEKLKTILREPVIRTIV